MWPKCHDEAHELGQVIYRKVQDVGRSLRICADRCYSGCMHGVLMAALNPVQDTARSGSNDDVSALKPMMTYVCYRDPEMTSAYSPGDCAHGVGHALMFLMRYDVPKALKGCAGFDERPMRYYCATGAYMEYVTERDAEDAKTRSLLYPCDTYEYPAACARHKMGYVALRYYRAGKTAEELVRECEKLQGKYRLGCFHGLGYAHSLMIAARKISIRTVCLHGNSQEQSMCIEGAIEWMAKYREEKAVSVCEELGGVNRQTCLTAVKNKMYSMRKDLRLYLK